MPFNLPPAIRELVAAWNNLRAYYYDTELAFTLDGRLVGDIGEALARERYGIALVHGHGTDGFAPDGRTVQIKATGTNGGPAFRFLAEENRADHLLFFSLSYTDCTAEIIYNGPEALFLNGCMWQSQKSFSMPYAVARNNLVSDNQRLPLLEGIS